MTFKDIFIFSSGSHFVQWRRMVCAILVEGFKKTFLRNYFDLGQEMLFKDISTFSSGGQFIFSLGQ